MLQSTEDWIQDFKQFLSDSPYSSVLENMYPQAQVHHGFLEQLQAVTDKAPNTTQNIGDVLMDMSGGVTPSLVIVTGQTMVLIDNVSSISAVLQHRSDNVAHLLLVCLVLLQFDSSVGSCFSK